MLQDYYRKTTLRHLKKGQYGYVVRILGVTPGSLHKMMALGLLPGERIEVLQTFPAYVLRLGHTQLALDRALAQTVEVEMR
jgi:Fe2+ transport system protein FeoA